MAGRVVDIHAHLLPRAGIRAHERGETWFGRRFDIGGGIIAAVSEGQRALLGSMDHLDPLQTRVEAMDRMGVDVEALSLVPPLYGYHLPTEVGIAAARAVNDELAAVAREWPHRFVALATLPLQDVPASLDEIDRTLGSLGMLGVAVGTHVAGRDWDDPSLFPVLERLAQARAFVFVHPADVRPKQMLGRYYLGNLVGNPFETTIAAASMIFGGVFDRLPDLTVCFAHGGGYVCFGAGRLDHGAAVRAEPRSAGMAALPTDYLRRLSFDSLTHSAAALRYLVDMVGPERVLLGSDFPADMGEPAPVEFVCSCPDLSEGAQAAILGGNAERLLGLGAEAQASSFSS